jgi:hypothetical protein
MTQQLAPITPPTSYAVASPTGSPVSFAISPLTPTDQGSYVISGGNPISVTGFRVGMAPAWRLFAAGETLTLTDSNGYVAAITKLGAETVNARLSPSLMYTITAANWSGGGFNAVLTWTPATTPQES